MDFVHDVLADGRRFRVLVVVDDCSRECLSLEVDPSITGQRVSRVLDRLRAEGVLPQVLVFEDRFQMPRHRGNLSSVRGVYDFCVTGRVSYAVQQLLGDVVPRKTDAEGDADILIRDFRFVR